MVMVSGSVNDPSDTVKVGLYVPVLDGVQVKVLVEALKEAPEGRLDAVYVKVSLSGSVADIVKDRVLFCCTALSPIGLSIGSLLTLFTVMVIVSVSVNDPSDTVKITLYVPD